MPLKQIPLPSRDYLRDALDYFPDTGQLIWKSRPLHHFKKQTSRGGPMQDCNAWNARYAGIPAFQTIRADKNTSYFCGRLDGIKMAAHRVIWKWVTGEDPDLIDHKDGNGLNNRFDNLRSVNQSVNLRNRKNARVRVPGNPGIYWREQTQEWEVYIRSLEGKRLHSSSYDTLSTAQSAKKFISLVYGTP